jgi:hypothetical protein
MKYFVKRLWRGDTTGGTGDPVLPVFLRREQR